ncbi:MAG: nitrous oxide-stimulated promoter family protein [Candidatus Marinimicrobia bacterium]|nr:nitrous oxide-stimulated promoter family protein [Candidatus Neomarinimicrobiota bacterium]MBL7009918.1 nitrous oxide-stimulated promoter family protein [Candidatus Neomarinimicrobiota bacterium]MBL7029783.1 nitrous oxide-stimulated promoter family protein [Candidatus Neomarinimicrobiota bacterium]
MTNPRLIREKETVDAMIQIYCSNNHNTESDLCAECTHLSDYAEHRLIHCPFDENKPTCVKCEIHCYTREMKNEIKMVMKYAGPRMLFRHPLLTIRHYINEHKSMGKLEE